MKNNLFIGIDPAFRAGGFSICIIDTSENTITFKTFKNGFLGFCDWFLNESPAAAVVCVENSNLTRATFDLKGSKLVIARKSRNVGKNQAISQNTVDLCKTKYHVINCTPKQKGKKWNKDIFNTVLIKEGHRTNKKRTNQDERDAYKLALIALKKPYLIEK